MINYLITTFAILWFCNSPKELIHIAVLTAIITLIASRQVYYHIDPKMLKELEEQEDEDND